VASHCAPFSGLDLDPGLLDRIGVLNGDRGIFERELSYLGARFLGPVQAFGGDANLFLGKGHVDAKKQMTGICLTC